MNLFVIGGFECPIKAPFPTHVPPVLAERGTQGFRRVFHDANMRAVKVPGETEWINKPTDILQKTSIIRCKPVTYSPGDQVIFLGNSKLLVTSSKFRILLALAPHFFSQRYVMALRTLINAIF
jgi:hypothetical protein